MLLKSLELLLLFFVLPSFFAYKKFKVPILPFLWLITAYCAFILYQSGKLGLTFLSVSDFFRYPAHSIAILSTLLLGTLIIGTLVRKLSPQFLFRFPRKKFRIWLFAMILYPTLSVYPQSIIYRSFFFERYSELFPGAELMILMSALTFAYVHIIFRHRYSVMATFIGGLLFAYRYAATDSLLLSTVEHALYGCMMFTIGLGHWFYYGDTIERISIQEQVTIQTIEVRIEAEEANENPSLQETG